MDRLIDYLKSTSVKLTLAIFAVLLILAVSIDITIHGQGGFLILFSLIYVLLPGLLFVFAIDKEFFARFRAQAVIIAFFCGFALLIGQYYLLNAIGFLYLIRFTPLAVIVLLALISAKKLKLLKPRFDKGVFLDKALPYLILVAITMVASYVALKSSVQDEYAPIHMDYAYHMGNVNILTRGGNLEDTRVMGMTFKYHYFMDLFYAVLRLVFPATIWNCIFRYPIMLIAPLAAPGIYSFARTRIKNPFFCFVLSVVVILFPSICPRIMNFSVLVTCNFNNVGFAIPLAVCLAQMLVFSARKNTFKYTDLVPIFLLCITLTGTKGPFALILIATMFVFMIYYSIAEREIAVSQILAFLSALAAFAIIWFAILNVAINDQNVHTQNQGLLKFFDYLVLLDEDSALVYHDRDPKYAPLTIPLSLIECFGASAIPFLIMIPVLFIRLFRKKNESTDYTTVFNTICVFVSAGGSYLLALGYNRLYFLMLATPFIYLSAAGFFAFTLQYKNKTLRIINTVLISISVVLLGITLYYSINDPVKIDWLEKPLPGETAGIEWIKENTDKNALFAINDHSPDGKHYYYSAVTERRFYLETYLYAGNSGKTVDDLKTQSDNNDQLFNDSNSPVIAQRLGIDYFIYYDTNGEIPQILEENYKLCFSNDCVRIYSRT